MATARGGDKAAVIIGELGKKLAAAQVVRVGFLGGSTEPNGAPTAMIAAIQEFGAPSRRIPPRPFFRNAIAKHKNEWPDAIATNLKANGYDAEKTLDQAGAAIAGQIRESIIETNAPPLSPVTLMLRKMFGNHPELIRGRDVGEAARRVAAGESSAGVSTKPLIWTGNLINSVDHEVVKSGS